MLGPTGQFVELSLCKTHTNFLRLMRLQKPNIVADTPINLKTSIKERLEQQNWAKNQINANINFHKRLSFLLKSHSLFITYRATRVIVLPRMDGNHWLITSCSLRT